MTICLVSNYCMSDCRIVLLFRMGIVLLNKQNMLRNLQPLIWTEPAVVKSFKQPSLSKQTAELKVFELPKAKKANRKFVLNHCRYNSQNPLSKVCFIAKYGVACINILHVVIANCCGCSCQKLEQFIRFTTYLYLIFLSSIIIVFVR